MNNSLEQETQEEFVEKYNLIFEKPKKSIKNEEKTINQILDSDDENEIEEDNENSIKEDILEEDNENTDNENGEDLIDDEERAEECTALVTVKERRLMAAQTMFKKSIKISLKSFLISLSLSFLNLFI